MSTAQQTKWSTERYGPARRRDRRGGAGTTARPGPVPRPVARGGRSLLHATLILRLVGGDLAGNRVAWQWGGSLNEVALLLFLALAATAVLRARPARLAHDRLGEGRPKVSGR